MSVDEPSGDKSRELQIEIDRLSAEFGVRSMPIGMRTSDGLNIFVDDDGAYHFAFYERGKLGFDRGRWAKRRVRQLAEMFRNRKKPEDIALLPDVGEPL